jgi:hypothetical protein
MIVSSEIASITILMRVKHDNEIINKIIPFKVYRHQQQYKAVPLVSPEDKAMTNLPDEVVFTFADNTIMAGEDLDNERLGIVSNIIRELKILRVV